MCYIVLLTGGIKPGRDAADHTSSAQSAPPLPAAPSEEGGGVSAAGQGGVRRQV